MALIERVMKIDGFVTAVPLNAHAFAAANHQRMEGQLTRQNVIDMFAMNAADITEYDLLAALAPTGSTALATAQKAMFIEKVHCILLLAEGGYTGYTTPALVRAKLGL